MKVTFDVISSLAYDVNAMKLVEAVSIALAEHHRDSIKSGKHPSGGPLPKLDADSVDGSFGPRVKNTWFMRSGKTVEKWWLGKLTGTSTKAGRLLKTPTPITEHGKRIPWIINAWLRRRVPIDLQSIDGASATVIQKTVDKWLKDAVGDGVSTAKEINRGQTTLDKLKK